MILVDTSVWVDHLRAGTPTLSAALEQGMVLTHPFVLGELACGNLKNREEVLELLGDLPRAPLARIWRRSNSSSGARSWGGVSGISMFICWLRWHCPEPRHCGHATGGSLQWLGT